MVTRPNLIGLALTLPVVALDLVVGILVVRRIKRLRP